MADCFSLPNAACEKIKTPFAEIVVGGDEEKPCFSIVWYENKELNIGYSSYCLSFVFQWLHDCFDVPGGRFDFIEQLLAENAKLKAERDAFMMDFIKGFKEQIEEYHGKYRCDICKHGVEQRCAIGECNGFRKWEWRGMQNA